VVTREELHSRLWPKDTFVDFERGLNTEPAISEPPASKGNRTRVFVAAAVSVAATAMAAYFIAHRPAPTAVRYRQIYVPARAGPGGAVRAVD
jgi:hypothetical protein